MASEGSIHLNSRLPAFLWLPSPRLWPGRPLTTSGRGQSTVSCQAGVELPPAEKLPLQPPFCSTWKPGKRQGLGTRGRERGRGSTKGEAMYEGPGVHPAKQSKNPRGDITVYQFPTINMPIMYHTHTNKNRRKREKPYFYGKTVNS